MAYINKQLRHYITEMDREFYIPKYFEKFIEIHKSKENLLLKKGNECYCTHCHNTFISNKKISHYEKCPHCKGKYLIRRYTLKNYSTQKNLLLLDRIEDKFVIRVFELYSLYQSDIKSFRYQYREYRRVIFDDQNYNETIESDIVFHTMGLSVVQYWKRHTCWKKKEWSYYYSQYSHTVGDICPYNIKQLLKDTKYRYSYLWKEVQHIDNIDLVILFQRQLSYYANIFETLVKLKLYNLALEPSKFYNFKSFKDYKQFLPFMQRHNLTYEEWEAFKYIKNPNICCIRALAGCYNLEWLSQFVDLETSFRNGLNRRNEHEYKDYIKFCIKLNYDMTDKNILYPKNINKAHDKLEKLVEICENEANTRLLQERYKTLKDNIYKTSKYIIYPASSSDELIEESKQQSNCVKTYLDKMAFAECDIYFLRENANPSKSLVTVEVRNNIVVQAKIKYNQEPTKQQWAFLNRWQVKILSKGVN